MTSIWFGVDAGGTRTRVLATDGHREWSAEFASVNRATVGDDAATANLRDAFAAIREEFVAMTWSGWIGSAGVSDATLREEQKRVRLALHGLGVQGRMVLAGDAAALLLAPPVEGNGLVLIAGTGSSVIGRARGGTTAVVGGVEYLLSDEGGGFDIGLNGLRAAARACDGRGAATRLVAAAEAEYGFSIGALGRTLAGRAFPKASVAAFAQAVVDQWQKGDEVASAVIAKAVEDLVEACRACWHRSSFAPDDAVFGVMTGGLLRSSAFGTALHTALRTAVPNVVFEITESPVRHALCCARLSLPAARVHPLPAVELELS